MDEKKLSVLRQLRLTLAFSLVVSVIIMLTMALIFSGAHLLHYLGVLSSSRFDRFPLFAFCLVSIAVGTLVSALVSRAPLKPIRELMAATDRIAGGDYSTRIDLGGTEDFRALSRKFNHMAEELGSVELLRTDFVNNFSHEFKTPIVSIRGFARALKWDDLSPEEQTEYLDIIISESERLAALSNNVLYLSKLERQTILTDKKQFNVSEQIRLAVALLDQKLSEKQLEIVFDSDEFFTDGNEEMMKQVWINLLDNAIKFSPTGGEVTISAKQTDGKLSVQISNQGEEIPPEAKEHIFDKFYQGDLSHATAGNGLGLAIVKKIVDLHGGHISACSSEQGSTFEVILPLSPL